MKIVCQIAAGLVLSVLPLLAAAAPLPASAAAAASAASSAGPELAAFKKAIRSKYDLKERAFAAHDPAPILEHFYTADVISVGRVRASSSAASRSGHSSGRRSTASGCARGIFS
jgi:hypothetical protein